MGFGQGSWGVNSWGGTGIAGESLSLPESLILNESVLVELPLRVLGAASLSNYSVAVYFSHNLDPAFLPNFTPSNYSTTPPLTVISSSIYGSSQNIIRLITSEQSSTTYTLLVSQARSISGDLLDPLVDEALFSGQTSPNYFTTAQGRRKVELIFSAEMLVDSAFINPVNYRIDDFNGNSIAIVSATVSGLTPISRITLELSSDLIPGGYYVSTVSANVKTIEGFTLYPSTYAFRWNEMRAPVYVGPLVIPIGNFSGEVTEGLLGQPAGQIFFSPALEQSAAGSILQVDTASVCTRAYDEYSFPELRDPSPLFTFSPNAGQTFLNQNSLWTTAERQGLARINLSNFPSDITVFPVDGPAIATLEEPVDYTRAGFLNDYEILLKGDPPTVRSHLYDGVGKTFICADNLAPVGPGTPVETVLQGFGFSEVVGLSESLTVS